MMKKIHITNRTFVLTAAIGSFLIMVMVIANTFWASRQTVNTTDEAVTAVSSFYLEAMADRRAKTVLNLINNNFEHMEKVLPVLVDEGIENQEHLRQMIGKITSLLSLNRFALVDEDNIVYTQYTTYTGGSRHGYLSSDELTGRTISTVYLYGSQKQLCLAIPTGDITIMGKRFKACFVQLDIKEIVDLLAFDDGGRTYFAIYSKNGRNLSDTELGDVVADYNILEITKEILSAEEWEKLCSDFENEKEGSLYYNYNDVKETISYAPVTGTGWETVALIRENVIQEQIESISEEALSISNYQIVFTLIVMLVFTAILVIELRMISKKKLKEEQETSKTFKSMANTDSMTGVRNKHAYSETENMINRMVKKGELEKLAVVVCDINGLKYVNDTLGHAAGDKLIKDACSMICEYFSHGSVFRVGGDEFAVILQERGFEMLDETVKAFNTETEKHIGTDEVVVSIGYSILEKTDSQLRDVFERADQMMYDRKKYLKGLGAKTRE